MNPRRLARWITLGLIKNQHMGKKSKEVLYQELFSLYNTNEEFRDDDFHKKLSDTLKEIDTLPRSQQIWLFHKLFETF